MYNPMKGDPEFGSELRKRATPEFAAKERRSGIQALVFCIGLGLVMAGFGIHGIPTGEVFGGNRTGPTSAWEFAAMGIFLTVVGVWGLLREFRPPKA
jgi:hypothetical protein